MSVAQGPASAGPSFEPFAAVRFSASYMSNLVSPPYDIVDAEERARLAAVPHNAVHVDMPDPTLGERAYSEAAHLFESWVREGVLTFDDSPAFYGYSMARGGGVITGVIGAVGLRPSDVAAIRPHEETTPAARVDRARLLHHVEADLSPVWLLSAALDEMAIEPSTASATVVADGWKHQIWPMTDTSVIERIRHLVSAQPLAVADGHHRLSVAVDHAADCDHEPRVMALVSGLRATVPFIRPIHRIVRIDRPVTNLLETLRAAGVPAAAGSHDDVGSCLCAVASDEVVVIDGPVDVPDSVVVRRLLEGMSVNSVEYDHDLTRARTAAYDAATVAFLVRPPSPDHFLGAIHRGVRMPPKTTLFWPKPRTGMVFRTHRMP